MKSSKSESRKSAKKTYRSPKLQVYGDLRVLTKTKKGKKNDGGGGKPNTWMSGNQGQG